MNFKSIDLLGLSVSCLTLVSILCSSALAEPKGGGSTTEENCAEKEILQIVCPEGWDMAKDLSAGTNKCKGQLVKTKVCKPAARILLNNNNKPLQVITPASANQ